MARSRAPEKRRGGLLENREHQTLLRLQHGDPTIEDLRRQHDLGLHLRARPMRLVAAGALGDFARHVRSSLGRGFGALVHRQTYPL